MVIVAGSTRRALERPKLESAPIPPPDFAARRITSTSNPTISNVGPNPSRIDSNSEVVAVVDCAFICTSLDCKRAVSWSLFQKLGTWVANSFVAVPVEPAG
jgi:hypothetical protein